MRPRIRLLAAGLLALGLAGMSSTHPTFAASQQVADCSFATLQTDLQGGGDWYYAPGQCPSPIAFTSTITISASASLTAQGIDVTLDGRNSVQLFSVGFGATFGLTGLTLSHGSAQFSGAIDNNGALTITNSTLSGNSARYNGGAIYNYFGTMSIINSTLSGNSAGINGGAIFNAGGTATISNSTLSGNSASYNGGAMFNSGTATITGSTLTGNYAISGGAIHNGMSSTVSIGGTIVANNAGGNCSNNSGAFTDTGYNLESGTDCGFTGTGDLQNTDPKLDPTGLKNNGGPTQTIALTSGSPAIDHIPTSSGLCSATDQRGFTRPDNSETSCDMGAFEVQDQLPQTITFTSTPPNPAVYGGSYTPTATGGGSGNPVTFSIDSSSSPGACSLSSGAVSFTGVGTCLIDANQAGNSGYLPAPQVQQSVTITPAILTVTAINQSRLFGAPNPPLTVSYSGFVNGQTLGTSGVTGSPACSTTAVQSSPAGGYPITCTQGTLAAANYSFSLVPGTLTVTYSSPCLTGRHTGPLTVASGQSLCLGAGFSQTGPVRVNAGGALDGEGATITGPVQVNGATALRLCGVHLTGPLTVSSTTGPVLVGDDEGTTCAGNSITGPVQMNANHGGVEFDANTVIGPVFINHTTGTNPAPDASPVDDTGNTVTGPNKVTP